MKVSFVILAHAKERLVRINEKHRMACSAPGGRNCPCIRSSITRWAPPAFASRIPTRAPLIARTRVAHQFRILLDNSAKDILWGNAGFIQEVILMIHETVKRQRVPASETVEQPWPCQFVCCKKVIQTIGKCIIEPPHPGR